MQKYITTSTGKIGVLIGLSLSSVSSTSSIESTHDDDGYIHAIELRYNAPAIKKTRVENYVEFNYRMIESLANKYLSADYGFMNAVQKFAEYQVNLDEDFMKVLNELFQSKVNSQPSKKRF